MRFNPKSLEVLAAKTVLTEFGTYPLWVPKQIRNNLRSKLCLGGNFQKHTVRNNEPNCFQQIIIEPRLTFLSNEAGQIINSTNVTLTIPYGRGYLTEKDKDSLFGYPTSSRGSSHIYVGGEKTTITLSAINGNHRAMIKIKVRNADVHRVISVEGRRWIVNQNVRVRELQMIP